MVQPYQRKYHCELWASDRAPRGRVRRAIEGSNRMRAREEIRHALETDEPPTHGPWVWEAFDWDWEFDEMSRAHYCADYGPCDHCRRFSDERLATFDDYDEIRAERLAEDVVDEEASEEPLDGLDHGVP